MTNQKTDILSMRSPEFGRLRVDQVMTTVVMDAVPESRADDVGSFIMERSSAVPVMEGGRVVGIVSEFDLLAALEREKNLSELSAEDVMTRHVVCVPEDLCLTRAIYLLHAYHLICMPVVDQEGKLVGMLSRRDILREYLNSGAALCVL